MNKFILTIEASVNAAGGGSPTLDIIVDGIPVTSSTAITSLTGVGSDLFVFMLDFTGGFPTSLAFRFNGGSGDPGDVVSLDRVRINGHALAPGDLTATLIAQGATQSVVSTAAHDHLFGRVEPTLPDLGTPTVTGTGGDDADLRADDPAGDIIDGGAGADRILGFDGDDAIYGGDGDDEMFGQAGNDILVGGLGNDRLSGNAGDDLLFGGDGNDILLGEDGNDVLSGGDGDDNLTGGNGDDILYGDAGNDRLMDTAGANVMYGDAGNDVMIGGVDNDTIYGGDDNDQITGGKGDDYLSGDAGNDTVAGGLGVDTVLGGAGDDLLSGGAGADIIDGGADNDTINIANGDFAAGESITGGGGTDTIKLAVAQTVDFTTGTLATVGILTGSTGNDTVTLSISHYAGMFTTIDLGASAAAGDRLNVNVSGAVDITGATAATVSNTESGHLVGSAAADTLTITGAQLDALLIGAGTIAMGGGADTINLTSTSADLNTLGATNASITGLETISAATAAAGVTITLSAQTEGFTLTGSGFNDTITGGSGNDTLNGGAGNDLLSGGAGADIIDGGADNDTINIANGDFAAGESITGGAGTDNITLTNATTVDFSTGTITTVENLNGSGGNDTVTLTASQWVNFTNVNLGAGTDRTNVTVSGAVNISAIAAPTVTSVENGYLVGSGGNDTFTVTGAQLDAILNGNNNNAIDLGGGTDTINLLSTSADLNTLGAGNNNYIVNLSAISASAAAAGVTITLSAQTEGFTLTGSGFNDTITGGSGDDIIEGGAGNDTLNGNGGTSDTVTYVNAASAVTVSLANGAAQNTVGAGTDTLSNFENLTGSAFNDTLTGTAGDNIIDGGAGNDTIDGGNGDDTMIGGAGTDTATYVSAAAGVQVSLAIATAQYTVSAGTDTLSGFENLTGSGFGDVLTGDSGNNTLDGGAGNDVIDGGAGNDTLNGGAGNDTLNGGSGDDTINSGTTDSLAAQITAITTANPSVTYNATTGSFYKYVNFTMSWTSANSFAAETINGVAGHLVQINNAAENTAIDTLGGANPVWIGVNDAGTEGTFLMMGGPMNGIIMRSGGAAQNGIYANWAAGQPDAGSAGQDYIAQANGGQWSDEADSSFRRYVIEWEGSQLLNPTNTTTLSGGAGTDTLNGNVGQDIFLFETTSLGTIDTINNYDRTDLDKLDIADLLIGYVAGTSDDDLFARFVDTGANLDLEVDRDGAGGVYAFAKIATLTGAGGAGVVDQYNIEEFVANGLLVMV